MTPIRPRASRLRVWVLATALGYAIFHDGGVRLTEWNVCLLISGLAALVYWLRASPQDAAPWFGRGLGWAALLFPLYVVLQLVPLPVFLLRILSPARAQILEALTNVMPAARFAPLSIVPATTFQHLLGIIGYLLVFLCIGDIVRRSTERRLWTPVIPLIAIAALEAGWGLLQNTPGEPAHGTYGNRNYFAGLLEMILPLAVMYAAALLMRGLSRGASSGWNTLKGCVVLCVTIVIFAGLLQSMSKMGFLAGVSGLFVMGALAFGSRFQVWKKWMAVACLAGLLLFVLVFLPSDTAMKGFGDALTDGTGEGRLPIWRDTLRLIGAYPLFGCGLGGYDSAFLKYQTELIDVAFTMAHNDYLQLGAELGVVGFLILTGLMLPVFVKAVRAATRGPDRDTRYLGLGCAGGITAIGLHSLTDFNMYIPANALVLAWISGVCAGLPFPPKPTAAHRAIPGPLFFRKIAIALSFVLIVYAPAWIVFRTMFRSDPQAERVFCRLGICDTDAVLEAETSEHGGSVGDVPPVELLEALRRDAASPRRWCDLGESLLKSGNTQQARYCFARALDMGPDDPPTLLRAADFYHSVQDDKRSLEQTSRILSKATIYDKTIFDWYVAKKLGVTDILGDGLSSRRDSQAYLRYMIATGNTADVVNVWSWLAQRGYADDQLASEYVNFLFRKQRYETAAHDWAAYLGDRRNGYLESNWLFNGDFESEPLGSPFDWKMENPGGAQATLDQGVSHSGGRSLRIRFDGNENLAYSHVSQTAVITPGKYRFEAWVRTKEITTDQGISFHIFDPEASSRLDVKTEQFIGTNEWRRVEQTICASPQTKRLEVQVTRQRSWRFDSQISGTAWIDTVALRKAGEKCSATGDEH